MIKLVIPITALLMAVALLLLGSGLLNTLLALRAGIEGYADNTTGMIMSGYFLGFFIGTFLALPMIQRVGHIRSFACCAALASCAVLLHVLFVSPLTWGILRVMTGIVLVILYTVIESWLSAQTDGVNRGRVFAVYMVVNLVALAIAQQLLRFGTPEDFLLFAIAAMLISVSLVPITLTRIKQPDIHPVPPLKVSTMYRNAPVAVAGAVLSGLAMGAFWGMGAVFAGRSGLDSNGVATFMSAAIIGGALLQFPLGRYSDTHDRRLVIACVTGLAALAALGLWVAASTGIGLLLAIAIYGGFAFAIYPVSVAMLMDSLDAENIVSGASGLLFLHGIGAAFGPALAGQLMEWLNPQALAGYFIITQLALCFFAVWNLLNTEEAPSEHPAQFVAMVRTTPTVLEMMPDEEITEPVSTEGRSEP